MPRMGCGGGSDGSLLLGCSGIYEFYRQSQRLIDRVDGSEPIDRWIHTPRRRWPQTASVAMKQTSCPVSKYWQERLHQDDLRSTLHPDSEVSGQYGLPEVEPCGVLPGTRRPACRRQAQQTSGTICSKAPVLPCPACAASVGSPVGGDRYPSAPVGSVKMSCLQSWERTQTALSPKRSETICRCPVLRTFVRVSGGQTSGSRPRC